MKSIKKRIAQIIGEASMLWSETPTGVFQSDRAVELTDEIINNIKKPIDEIYTFAVNHFTNEQEKFEFFKWWSEKYYQEKIDNNKN
jgi:hypothetical protein